MFGLGKKKPARVAAAIAASVGLASPAQALAQQAHGQRTQPARPLHGHQTAVEAFCAVYAVAIRFGASPEQAAREALHDLSERASLHVRHENDLRTFRRVLAMLTEGRGA